MYIKHIAMQCILRLGVSYSVFVTEEKFLYFMLKNMNPYYNLN